jgi:cysteine desulfurase
VVYAIESHPTVVLDVDQQGNFQRPAAAPQDLLVWQAANPETGLIGQSLEKFEGQLFVDSVTSSASSISWNLPHWSSAIWDSRAWRGPSGISIFGLKDRNKWRNPLPHNDARVTSGHFSIPLALASALALEASVKSSTEDQATLRHLNQLARTFISQEIPGSQIACNIDQTDPALLSFTIPEMDSQLLVQELDRIGIEVDTGSACSSMNMQPSHVLAAMGFNTTGHVRVTLRPTITPDQLLWALQEIKRISAPSED